ncbi:DUF362 domain-containing protein [Desulfovibrio ferrophilus]|uniref:DUF362 domain-containing protein n=1 Tax=Desulfovibrio ferrophilus TaxID=241368 RepID=A0A2Z6AYP7_9BACT|nr:DUF362 domain-containing protein [Desulfovibrio ferrophilus]BBD08387.1 uncharacterized protein DFE_1661 [Desulfovibrio ferrophilus]
MSTTATPVALTHCPSYDTVVLTQSVASVFSAIDFAPASGTRVLIKPNLVSASKGPLGCSEPAMVRAACLWLKDHGCRVTVGDSPAFGSAKGVADKVGITAALKGLDVPIISLGKPRPLDLSFGGCIGLSAMACEADIILNLPRLKAHCQMTITASVKNLFGCVTGMRKAIAHTRFGEQDNRFEAMILDVAAALPPVVTLLDGVNCMHVTGPTGGETFELGLIGASNCPVSLDTALYSILHLSPGAIALWREAQARNTPGAQLHELSFPLEQPEAFDATGFEIPGQLTPVSFHPVRLAKGALKRVLTRLKETPGDQN